MIKLPIAHFEGAYESKDPEFLMESERIVFRYCDSKGNINPRSNPNGSLLNIAGICNDNGMILGLMPHPERAVRSFQGSGLSLREHTFRDEGGVSQAHCRYTGEDVRRG